MRRLILASASPARRFLLETAGLTPEVIVSHVDEGGLDHVPARQAVAELARRKGRAVATRLGPTDAFIVACDSLLEFEDESWGKVTGEDEVVTRWKRLRGGTGYLHTGHVVIDGMTGAEADETDTAVVRFGHPSDAEIQAYATTEESRQVAGPFTLEGRSAPWIDSIDGNYGTITGISLPVLRRLLARFDTGIVDLWN